MRDFWIYYNTNTIGSDFLIDEFGWYFSPPSYEFRENRVNYILHFVKKGTCDFTIWDKHGESTVTVKEGEAICVFPGYEHKYHANDKDGCVRFWLSFRGNAVTEVLQKCNVPRPNSIIKNVDCEFIQKAIEGLCHNIRKNGDPTFYIYTAACSVFDHIENVNTVKTDAIRKTEKNILIDSVSNYIDNNLSTVTVRSIADRFGYEKSYLYRIFMQECGMSVQRFIAKKKVNRAKSLLTTTDVKLDYITDQVGYESYIAFSKIFKEYTGFTPTQYRAAQNQKTPFKEDDNE